MNFYQQKYFKPYHQLVCTPQKTEEVHFRTPTTNKYRPPDRISYTDKYNIQPVWDYLYNEGLRNQKQLMQKHELSKNKIDIECTFKPQIRQNKRYLIPSHSNFLERNNLWMENKIQKIVKEKQEEISKGLKQCTFAPQINEKSKRAKPDQFQNKIHRKTCPNHKLHKSAIRPHQARHEHIEQVPRPTKPSKKVSYVDIDRAKLMIKNELKRLAL